MYSPASVPGMTVGLDVGDRFCDACFLDGEAQVIESSRIRTAPAALEYRFAQIAPVRVVLETGKHSPWISGGLLSPCAPPCPRITPSRADASPGSARFPERADPQL